AEEGNRITGRWSRHTAVCSRALQVHDGKGGTRAPVRGWLDQPGPEVVSVACEIRRLRGDGSVAYKLAAFETTMRDTETGGRQVVTGSHLWVLERSAQGEWLVALVTWSIDG
ncbi:MAG: hypothetical protein ACM32J_00440, partial [Rhizobacter sp.]